MATSTHVYRAFLIGSPDLELDIRGGRITLDTGNSPHVTGTLDIAIPDGVWDTELVEYPDGEGYGFGEPPFGVTGFGGFYNAAVWDPDTDTLPLLDPRTTPRIRVEVDADTDAGAQSREFDLSLRDRSVDYSSGIVTLTLASDESLLEDYAPLDDDSYPMLISGSLRDVIDYVLDTVIPGAALESTPSTDADVGPYWDVTNLLNDPAGEASDFTISYRLGTGASDPTQVTSPTPIVGTYVWRWETATGDSNIQLAPEYNTYRVNPLETYTARVYVRSQVSRDAQFGLRFFSESGKRVKDVLADVVSTPTSGWAPLSVTGTAPSSASYVAPIIFTEGNSSGQHHYFDAAMLYEGEYLLDYFDGNTTDGGGYLYDWTDAANAGPSTRTAYPVDRDPEALIWKAGQSALDFLHPLYQAAGLRLVCDENREWTLRGDGYFTGGSSSIRYGVNLVDGRETISRSAGIWMDAAVTRYTWTDSAGRERIRHDEYAVDTPHTRTVLFERDTPYPGPGFSEYAVTRAQQRGREVVATAVANWRVTTEQAITVQLPETPIQTGLTQAVEFDLDRDEMTITTRTADTIAAAWVLIPEGETWLDQPAGESWTEEIISV